MMRTLHKSATQRAIEKPVRPSCRLHPRPVRPQKLLKGRGQARTSGFTGAESSCAAGADWEATFDRVTARNTYSTMARTASQAIHMSAAL